MTLCLVSVYAVNNTYLQREKITNVSQLGSKAAVIKP